MMFMLVLRFGLGNCWIEVPGAIAVQRCHSKSPPDFRLDISQEVQQHLIG
jgi:hypothetical protein